MTGYQYLAATSKSGMLDFVQDSGTTDFSWIKMNWTASIPTGTSIKVEARAANQYTHLTGHMDNGVFVVNNFVPIQANALINGIAGRFVEVRITFIREWNTSNIPTMQQFQILRQ